MTKLADATPEELEELRAMFRGLVESIRQACETLQALIDLLREPIEEDGE